MSNSPGRVARWPISGSTSRWRAWCYPSNPNQDDCAAPPSGELAAEWTEGITVVDVRRRAEWDEAHLVGAHHIALHDLLGASLPPGQVWMHCAAGYRAALGASILQREGREVVAVDDGWGSARAAGLPITSG